jgi:raffinose/stachyose/melibiose transport system substrate-binding protein
MAKKSILVLFFFGCLFLPLFAGGQQGEGTAEPVEVEFFHDKVLWLDPWEEMTAEYERQHPSVSISSELVGGGADWRTALKTKAAAGEMPDLFKLEGKADYELFNEYILDLTGQSFVDYFVPVAKASAMFDGKNVGAAPLLLEGYGYIYSKKIFKDVGIADIPRNFSQLKDVCATLQGAGITPFASGFATWWVIGLHFTNIPMAHQPDPLGFIEGLNNGTAKIPGNKIFKEWQNIFDLVLANCEDNPLTVDHNTQVTMFANGDVAMIQQGNWKQPRIYDVDPDLPMGFVPISFNNDTKAMDRLPVGVPMFLAVNKQSSQAEIDVCMDFLEWFMTDDFAKMTMTDKFGSIPGYNTIDPATVKGDLSQDILRFAVAGKTVPWVFGYYTQGVVKEWGDLTQAYVGGQFDFDTLLRRMQESWDKNK